MDQKRIGAYVGIDPTAPSLHVGHLVPLMALFWMYVHGFQSVTLVSLVAALACPIPHVDRRRLEAPLPALEIRPGEPKIEDPCRLT